MRSIAECFEPRRSIAALLLCLSVAVPASARAEAFVTASAGQSSWDADCGAQLSCDLRDRAGTVRAGYMFSPYLGIEARYFDLGKASATFPSAFQDSTPLDGETSHWARGGGVNAILSLPFAQGFSVSGIAGIARTKATSRFSLPLNESSEASKQANKPYYGINLAYAVSADFALSLEADRYRVALTTGTVSIDMWGAGFSYRFR